LKGNTVRIRVIYADTDAMRVAYHGNYIRWFEIGRTELLREMGIVYAELESSGYNLSATEVYCHYLLPVRYDDIILVETRIDYLRRSILKFDYLIRDEERNKTLTEGYTIHIFTNNDGKIVRAPKTVAEKIV